MKKAEPKTEKAHKPAISAEKALEVVNGAKQRGITSEDFLQAMTEQRDETAKLMAGLVDKLYVNDLDGLLKVARVSDELGYFVLKWLILLHFYSQLFENVRVQKRIIPSPVKPYWTVETVYETKITTGISEKLEIFLREMLSLTISYRGQGRIEVLEMAKTMIMRVMEDKLEKPSILNRVGLG